MTGKIFSNFVIAIECKSSWIIKCITFLRKAFFITVFFCHQRGNKNATHEINTYIKNYDIYCFVKIVIKVFTRFKLTEFYLRLLAKYLQLSALVYFFTQLPYLCSPYLLTFSYFRFIFIRALKIVDWKIEDNIFFSYSLATLVWNRIFYEQVKWNFSELRVSTSAGR